MNAAEVLSCIFIIAAWLVCVGCFVRAVFVRRGMKLVFVIVGVAVSVLFLLTAALCASFAQQTLSGEKGFWDVFLSLPEKIVATLQFFSMDADYGELLQSGALFEFSVHWRRLFNLSAFLLTLFAPLLGGAVLISVVGKFFPEMRLYLNISREKYIFSELNERSIWLAESLYDEKVKGKYKFAPGNVSRFAAIVFADSDRDNPQKGELLQRAKDIGAICVNDSIDSLSYNRLKLSHKKRKLTYFFISDKESENLTASVMATESPAVLKRWNNAETQVFVFSHNPDTEKIVEGAYKKYINGANDGRKNYDIKVIKTVREFENLVYDLIDGKYPLVKPWFRTEKEGDAACGKDLPDIEKIRVLVVGGGRIARHFLKSVPWCAQIFSPRSVVTAEGGKQFKRAEVEIRVIADNAKENIEPRLKFEMPGVFGKTGRQYCKFQFFNAVFGREGFAEKFCEDGCYNADYVLVAMGDDVLNARCAMWINEHIQCGNGGRRPVINVVIEDSGLCASLNAINDKSDSCCELHPFGSLKERYSYENVFLNDISEKAYYQNWAYAKTSRRVFELDNYSSQSSAVSAIHYRYKLFSLGLIQTSKEWENVYGDNDGKLSEKIIELSGDKKTVNELVWLEHVRWMMYLFSAGYVCPTVGQFKEEISKQDGTNKSHMRKWHSCLVDSEKSYNLTDVILKEVKEKALEYFKKALNSSENDNKLLDDWIVFDGAAAEKYNLDKLDMLSLLISAVKNKTEVYDYKDNDVRMVYGMAINEKRILILKKIDGLSRREKKNLREKLLNLIEEIVSLIKNSNEWVKKMWLKDEKGYRIFTLGDARDGKNYCIKISEDWTNYEIYGENGYEK